MAPFIVWSALVTPTEIAFFNNDDDVKPHPTSAGGWVMFVLNKLVESQRTAQTGAIENSTFGFERLECTIESVLESPL